MASVPPQPTTAYVFVTHSARAMWRRRPGMPLLLAVVMAALGLAPPAAAHPHVFVEHRIAVLFADGAPKLRLSWTFDEMYSSMIKSDFIKSKGPQPSAEDVRRIEQRAFSNLAKYGYFISLKLNKETIAVKSVSDFAVRLAGGKAVYEFTVALPVRPRAGENAIEVAVFDPDYFVQFDLAKDGLSTSGTETAGAACEAVADIRPAELYGDIDSDTVRCRFQGK